MAPKQKIISIGLSLFIFSAFFASPLPAELTKNGSILVMTIFSRAKV